MEISEGIRIGVLLKTHGYRGDFLLKTDPFFLKNFKEPESVFLLIEGILVPFFIHSIYQTSPPFFIIHLEGIDDLNSAVEHVRREIFIPAEDIIVKNAQSLLDKNYAGYRVFDQYFEEVGVVKEVTRIPGNTLLIVVSGEGERMIPFHADLIVEINSEKKILKIDIPEGI